MAFNLLDEAWLTLRPVGADLGADHSLREALLGAHQFEGLVVDLPTQLPALLRQVLLPVVLDALGRPKNRADWLRHFHAGAFTDAQRKTLEAYLEEHQDRFDLFHPTDPFAQVAGLRTAKNDTKGAALLVATAATGNNVPLFACRTEGDPFPLTPAQAARWLLHTHCWDTAAIKTGAVGDPHVKAGKTTGNPTGPLGQLGVVVPLGRTLYETLLLNLPFGPTLPSDDRPQWRRRALEGPVEETLSVALPAWQTRAPKGLLDLWTWQSRRIRLIPEETAQGTRVTRVVIAAGDRMREVPVDLEPHTAWKLESTGKKTAGPAQRPRRRQPGKAAWRGLDALLATDRETVEATAKSAGFATSGLLDQLRQVSDDLPADYPLQVELTGIAYGTQSAVVEDVLFDSIPLPLTALGRETLAHAALLEVTEQAEALAAAVNNLSADLRRAAGADPIPWDRGQRPGELVLHALDPVVRRLLTQMRAAEEDLDRVEEWQRAWEHAAARRTREIAAQVVSASAPGTFAGRTFQQGGRDLTYRLATAQQNFASQLRRILTRAAEDWQAERRARAAATATTEPDRG